MIRHEAVKPKIPEFHFAPEGYVSSSDPEYLDQLLQMLRDNNFNPDQLVFSGFDGKEIVQGRQPPRHDGIYIMNAAGWRRSYKLPDDDNPAEYAERWSGKGVPCVGLYDKDQLVQIYSHGTPEHPENLTPSDEDWRDVQFEGTTLQVADDVANEGVDPRHTPKPHDEYIEEREEFTNIDPGTPLREIPVDEPLEMAVIHGNYPNGSPTDALLAVVFLEEATREPTRDHGF